MADPPSRLCIPVPRVSLALVLEWALGLRILAGVLVHWWYTQRKGALCIFPDTRIYWLLAETIGARFSITADPGRARDSLDIGSAQ